MSAAPAAERLSEVVYLVYFTLFNFFLHNINPVALVSGIGFKMELIKAKFCVNIKNDLINLLQAMLYFESDIEKLYGKYLVIERHILQIKDML